jgi:thiosulfate/3-mercaptopyruvate sulfurtransferase
MTNSLPNLLIEPEWLEAHIADPSVRVIDTSVNIVPQPPGPSEYTSLYEQHLEMHIPGAGYLHMVDDLSDPNGSFPFALPPVELVWQQLSELGISNTDTIVLYGNEVHWATHRCWWVLATAGADVRILNTNFTQWCAAGRPTESGKNNFEKSRFEGQFNSKWVAKKRDVVASIENDSTALINALSAEQFAGKGQPFGRPGRIPGSISVPSAGFVDRNTGMFLSLDKLAQQFDQAGATSYEQLITYCGGGIAASTTFFALHMLGYKNISLYDGSLLEWSVDPDLPLIVDKKTGESQ